MRSLLIATLMLLGGCALDEGVEPADAGARPDGGADPAADAGPTADARPPAPPPTADCDTPPRRVLRRLTHAEYARTVSDLLGVTVDATEAFGADPRADVFSNDAEALRVTTLLADQYRTVAEDVASQVDPGILGTCDDRGCAALVRAQGRRLFRRPLTQEEAARYRALAEAAQAEGESPDDVARLVLAALLQSPHFLYRTELGRRDGEVFVLTGYELATALAYLIWGSAPDDALLDAAGLGELDDADGRAASVERLLADPRATAAVQGFVRDWLGLERLPQVNRDPEVYPTLTPALRASMAEETDRVVARLWAADAPLAELLTGAATEVDDALAAHYGLPPVGPGFQPVERPADQAAGVLTHASVLTTWALPLGSSPIHRGLFVRERLLCQDLPPPPANLNTAPPAVDPRRSTRERYAQHADDPSCSGCHGLIDPIGFAFEHFDGIGRYRERDGEHAIDATGRIVGSRDSNGEFDGAGALARHLAASPEVARCHATQWLRMASGGVEGACADALDGDRLRGPLEGILARPTFGLRTGEPGELDVPGDPPGQEPEPEPEPEPPPAVGARLALERVSEWATGYCANGRVTNDGDMRLRWRVQADIQGTIDNLWNAQADADTGLVHFIGMDYNAELEPGQSADFGFCARL
ncbi:MAG: DUF1592 domain-containing protein [bacterium]